MEQITHTYLVLAHKGPEQIARLVERLEGPGVRTVVHIDSRSPEAVHTAVAALGARPDVTVARPRPTPWGGMHVVRATLELLGEIRADHDPDYVSLLSGQDYPLKPPSAVAERLRDAQGASFLQHFPIPRHPDTTYRGAHDALGWVDGGESRIRSWSWVIRGREFRLPNNRIRLPVHRRLPEGVRFHGGGQWWTLSRAAIAEADRLAAERPDVVRFFRRVCVPDEIFFQTLLADAPGAGGLVNDALRYTDWTTEVGGAHPKVLVTADVPALAASGALFARKFDPAADSRVLDAIDRELLGL